MFKLPLSKIKSIWITSTNPTLQRRAGTSCSNLPTNSRPETWSTSTLPSQTTQSRRTPDHALSTQKNLRKSRESLLETNRASTVCRAKMRRATARLEAQRRFFLKRTTHIQNQVWTRAHPLPTRNRNEWRSGRTSSARAWTLPMEGLRTILIERTQQTPTLVWDLEQWRDGAWIFETMLEITLQDDFIWRLRGIHNKSTTQRN